MRRTEVSIEMEQLMVIQRRRGSVTSRCKECDVEVVMLTPDEAALVTLASTRSLYRMIDSGMVHFEETPAGLIRLCLPSLVQALGGEKKTLNFTA